MKRSLTLLLICLLACSALSAQNLKPKRDKATKKYGYVDSSDRWVIDPVYDDADRFKNGVAEIKLNKKRGLAAADGKILFEPQFDDIESFRDGIAIVKLNKREGFISIDGKLLCEPVYESVGKFYNGIAVIKQNRKEGLIAADGNVLLEPCYDNIETPLSDLNHVRQGYCYGAIDRIGGVIFEPIYSNRLYFNRYGISLACIKRGDIALYGLVGNDGREVLPVECPFIQENDGRFFVERNSNEWAIYDAAAQFSAGPFEEIARLRGDSGEEFASRNGLVAVRAGDLWGFVNIKGELVVPFRYDAIGFGGYGFNRGLCSVNVGGLWGYIREDGSWFAPAVFTEAGPFVKTDQGAAAKVGIRRRGYLLFAEGCRLVSTAPSPDGKPNAPVDPAEEHFNKDQRPQGGQQGGQPTQHPQRPGQTR